MIYILYTSHYKCQSKTKFVLTGENVDVAEPSCLHRYEASLLRRQLPGTYTLPHASSPS